MKGSIIRWMEEHKKELLDDISELIRIDSTRKAPIEGCPFGKDAAEALKCAERIITDYGFKATNLDNYVCYADMNELKPGLDILAHLDVVPADSSEWTVTKPFEPIVKDGCLYGRGTADDKGPAVAALFAMRAVRELGINLKRNVRLILGSDEECCGQDIEYYYERYNPAEYTISPDAEFPVVNVERGRYVSGYIAQLKNESENIISIHCGSKDNVIPGLMEVVVKSLSSKEKAIMCARADELGVEIDFLSEEGRAVIHIKGVSGHAAEPETAVNALTAALDIFTYLSWDSELMKALDGINKIFPFGDHYGVAAGIFAEDEISGRLTSSLNRLDYEQGFLDCTFDSRVPESADDSIIDIMKIRGAYYGLTLKGGKISKPHIVKADSFFIKTLLDCYEEVSGEKGYTISMGGGTYVHDIENGVAFGPAEPEIKTNIHSFDENIPVSKLIDAAVIYALAIVRICGE